MTNTLSLNNVTKIYRRGLPNQISVLDQVNLEVKKGEVVGLIAPSGAGKSTLLHISGLLDNSDNGQVIINGIDYNNLDDKKRTKCRRQDIGFIYQFHHLLPEFSAIENLTLPQLANGTRSSDAKQRSMELLKSVNLQDRAFHRPDELSGGEQQRVAFCRAMVNSPKLLLADEPTGNLDPDTAMIVFNLLMELVRNTGMSAVIATHNYELSKLMDRQLALRKGKLVEV
ncbi:ABC transporter ATP-binding protein [Amylibacter sp.]|mgnify:FL=1|nr:ABC transporter ATP-binding protein [Amylibacter sp.]MDB0033114.1 ABC transporter ATP-binding protein [Amylibacter sp.]MDC3303999.1 ABC transporter ATP-binding protein [Amylibacter sp.]|tara:strand:+ start:2944 stop:3624 length:681 start_codon:yes stop_codon:yes gene_type:complete